MNEFMVSRILNGTVVNNEVVTEEWLSTTADWDAGFQFVRISPEAIPIIGSKWTEADGFTDVEVVLTDDELDGLESDELSHVIEAALAGE